MSFMQKMMQGVKQLSFGREIPQTKRKQKFHNGKITCKVCRWRKTHSQHEICLHCLQNHSYADDLKLLIKELNII